MKHKVSVIVPVFGVEKYIERCARSLFNQTFKDIEFIFVNDCTKDNSINILKKVILEYPNIDVRIINKSINEGLPQARNTGLQIASGEYIIHIDSDDWIEENAIEILYDEAIKSNVDMVYCDWIEEWPTKSIRFRQKFLSKKEYFESILALESYAYVWNRLVKRELYSNNFVFPHFNMLEDFVITSQLLDRTEKLSYIPKPLNHYFKNNNNSIASSSNLKKIITQKILNIFFVYRTIGGKLDNQYFSRSKARMILVMAWSCFRLNLYKSIDSSVVDLIRKDLKKLPLSTKWGISIFKQLLLHLFF